jgi:ubiquinone/menaquinone biosynthesis C-methylase UbiE
MEALRVARTRGDLERTGLTDAAIDALLMAGLLEETATTRPPSDYVAAFSGWKSQRGMLVDHVRTTAFQKAIQSVVKPGARVVDVGTGSGVLAMFAARAGAAEVYGLEVTDMAVWADRLAKKNGLSAVKIIKGDAASFELGDKADVIIGEFFGMTFFDEWRHYLAFVSVRDRVLRQGGAVVPQAARFLLSTVDSQKLYWERGYGFYEVPTYGLDFSDVRPSEIASPRRYIVTSDHSSIIGTETVAEFDFRTSGKDAFLFTTENTFTFPTSGNFHGFLAHFELEMAPGQLLGTGPHHRETCWHHTYLPLPRRLMRAGEALRLQTRTFVDPENDVLSLGLTVAGPDQSLDGAPEHVFRLE